MNEHRGCACKCIRVSCSEFSLVFPPRDQSCNRVLPLHLTVLPVKPAAERVLPREEVHIPPGARGFLVCFSLLCHLLSHCASPWSARLPVAVLSGVGALVPSLFSSRNFSSAQ